MLEKSENLDDIHDEYQQFKAGFKSVLLSTISQHGVPDSCYEDYVRYDGDYYIYASELASHTRNLMESGRASLLFIEGGQIDNVKPSHKRVVLNTSAERISRANPVFQKIMQLFELRFADFPQILASLSEFHLFRITTVNGAYVRGDAKAFLLEGERLLPPDNGPGCARAESRCPEAEAKVKRILQ